MRKSLLVLLLWVPFAAALVPSPGQRLDLPTQQAIQRFLLHNRILDTPRDLDTAPYIVAAEAGRVLGSQGERVHARATWTRPSRAMGSFAEARSTPTPRPMNCWVSTPMTSVLLAL